MQTSHLKLVNQAKNLLNNVKGKRITEQEHIQRTIELAKLLLQLSTKLQTKNEKAQQVQLARMMRDPKGKIFTMEMTDQCFRSSNPKRVANQIVFLLKRHGIPIYLNCLDRTLLFCFKALGELFPTLLVPLVKDYIQAQAAHVVLPGNTPSLFKHIKKRKNEGVLLNINYLGEAVLSEYEAGRRLEVYKDLLSREEIGQISVKISSIYSQINLVDRAGSLEEICKRLRFLYQTAKRNSYPDSLENKRAKFVNLDMESFADLYLTKDAFMKVLSEPEFLQLSAGLALQAYLPDSWEVQQEITEWAKARVRDGGAPIKIRIVKGANLKSEQCMASIQGWPQSPFKNKQDTDINFKRMIHYALEPANARAVHIGVASHNLFDLASTMIVRSQNRVEDCVEFEMLEGMAGALRRSIQAVVGTVLLYCPITKKGDFNSAISYLMRRLDENTSDENFLRHSFELKIESLVWQQEVDKFTESFKFRNTLQLESRKKQSRLNDIDVINRNGDFQNEANTDFSLPDNQQWAEHILSNNNRSFGSIIPSVINARHISVKTDLGQGLDPSKIEQVFYRYTLASWEHIDLALTTSVEYLKEWRATSIEDRVKMMKRLSQLLRENRGELTSLMIIDGGKTIQEADAEVSEAIDFTNYYRTQIEQISSIKDIAIGPKGTLLVTPPWNFPLAIPAGGVLAALLTGNCVLFKPAPETVLVAWKFVNLCWQVGIPEKALQFINCREEPEGSRLIQDRRLAGVILTGATSTARHFLRLRPDLELFAETGGKNGIIITALADRDLAIKDILHSAFSHSGQKCSAASLLICEKEIYEDSVFLNQLKEAAKSLQCGSADKGGSKVVPLIRKPEGALFKALTSLEEGESWLLEPHQDQQNPALWSPGIKLGVKRGSMMHQTELFGPLLGVMCADNLEHAIDLVNDTDYGLTSGLHSLDPREHEVWKSKINAGCCYINRKITGAIVRRQPFGGVKGSCFGQGFKAGGPHYLTQFMRIQQESMHFVGEEFPKVVEGLKPLIKDLMISSMELEIWELSVNSYKFWCSKMFTQHDPSLIVGQDNFHFYRPIDKLCVLVSPEDSLLDLLRIIAIAKICNHPLQISCPGVGVCVHFDSLNEKMAEDVIHIRENRDELVQRIQNGKIRRLRILRPTDPGFVKVCAQSGCFLDMAPVLVNGRFELLHYFEERSLSFDYNRYGNLGDRDREERAKIL